MNDILKRNESIETQTTSISSPESYGRESNETNHSNDNKKRYKKDALEPVDHLKEFKYDQKYKTELCKSFTEIGFCAYGNKCRFAHGKNELFDRIIICQKYKEKDCISFFNTGYCCYGSRCHFKHDERNLSQITKNFYAKKLNNLKVFSNKDIWTIPIDNISSSIKNINKNVPLFIYINNHKNIIRKNKFNNDLSNNNNNNNFKQILNSFDNLNLNKKFNFQNSNFASFNSGRIL